MNHIIPHLEDPMNSTWIQPYRQNILIDETTAVMSAKNFGMLKEYTFSDPSGVYPGKMWFCRMYPADSSELHPYLRWYGPIVGENSCQIYSRRIQIMDWQALMGIAS